MAPFKNDCGQKNPIQAVQDTTWHLLKMTVAKKTEPNSVNYKMAAFRKDCGQKTEQCRIQNGTF